MKTEKLVWGLILVFIGGIFLLENFHVIDFYWRTIWKFWPIVLILIGVNMLFSRSEAAASPYVAVVLTVLVLIFIGYQGSMPPGENDKDWMHYNFKHEHDRDNDRDRSEWTENTLTEPYNDSVAYARLNIRGGATSYSIDDSTASLVDAQVRSSHNGYTLTNTMDDSVQVVNFNMNSKNKQFRLNDVDGNDAKIKLNTRPIWSINVNVGAGESKFDLSGFKVSKLDFHGGAASFQAKLGIPPTALTTVSANTGVAEVKLEVPESVGCQIKVKSGLSSKDFEGFSKQGDGTFVTSNFHTAGKKIIIDLRGGLSDFEVSRY